MKQTAVDWLINELPTVDWNDPWYRDKLSQAKAMEKEQIGDAFDNGCVNIHIASNSIGIPYNKEKYYNETYGK